MKIFRIWSAQGVSLGRFKAHAVELAPDGSLHGYDGAKVPNLLWCFRPGAYGGYAWDEYLI